MSKARDGVEDLKTIDANFAAKLPLAGGTMTGALDVNAAATLGGGTDEIQIIGGGGTARVDAIGGNTNVNLSLSTKGSGKVYFWRGGYGGTQMALLDSDGLKFGADTAAANALDDYEEGTWTPTIGSSSATTVGYGNRTARYTKVGQLVTWNCSIQWSSKSGGSGSLTVSLPFAVNATGQWQGGAGCSYAGGITQTIRGSGYSESNAAHCYLASAASNTGNIAASQMGTSGHLIMGGSYQTSS